MHELKLRNLNGHIKLEELEANIQIYAKNEAGVSCKHGEKLMFDYGFDWF